MDEISPECMSQIQRKARKDHVCCECRRVIKAGTVYEYTSGIWDKEPSSYKTCPRCVLLREAMAKVNGWPPPAFWCLLSEIKRMVQDEGHAWAVRFKAAVKGLTKD
jgi:hypothetical protein